MFASVLIANRGEIACRVIRTAHRMGIAAVAVYSEADAGAMHVAMADRAVCIGGAAAGDSYLSIGKIVEAAKRTGAEAIHPGYGFLSENAEFCRACEEAGIAFVGPPAAAIEAMGSKAAAKRIMETAGVPLVPGYHGAKQDAATLLSEAEKIGFPVLLKAAAGGGGKGLRRVCSADGFDDELRAARREATAGFGDDAMLVEKYLARSRHVEVQVFFDNRGAGVYLGDRDCSVQRRHQKVIEEAPAPGLSDELRREMGETAVRAARAIDYRGAGTVEFLLDEDGSFYFMEMNTRLQVEHPVTEMVTGEDLVEWQFRVAAGAPLPRAQADIAVTGHALEARIYAEDPERDFVPVAGRLDYLRPPEESDHVRIDTGVRRGDEVTVHYDPMIAKLIVRDEDRERALRRLREALAEYRVAGLTTNIDFLHDVAASAPFREAALDTGFVERHGDRILCRKPAEERRELALAALCLLLHGDRAARRAAAVHPDPNSPWHTHTAWRVNEPHVHRLSLRYREREVEIAAERCAGADSPRYLLDFADGPARVGGELRGESLDADIDGRRRKLTVFERDGVYSCYGPEGAFRFEVPRSDAGAAGDAGPGGNPRAPMTGVIVALLAEPGQTVAANAPLLTMEAMKMEHTVRAPAAGVVKEFFFQPGDLVDGDAELLDFEAGGP